MRVFRRLGVLMVMVTILLMAQPALAIHFYRNTGSGCSAEDKPLITDDDPQTGSGDVTAVVQLWHNSFYDKDAPITESNVTRINVGEAVKWTWNSAHCHSVQDNIPPVNINSGFHYPTTAPDSPQVVPGFFDYPVLTNNPTLSFVHTFNVAGIYSYFCIHHRAIGMVATVIVE